MRQVLIAMFALVSFLPFVYAQNAAKPSKVDKDYEWESVEEGLEGLYFRIIAIGEKGDFSYYVRINSEKYVKIQAQTGNNFGQMYFLPDYKSDKLPLFKREIKDGEEVFTPLTVVELGKSKNVIIGVAGDGTKNKVLAISTDAIPLGSYAIANVSELTLGIRMNKKASKLSSFNMVVREPRSKTSAGTGVEKIDVYDISGSTPKSYANFTVDVPPNKRVIVYMFKPKYTIAGPDQNQVKIEVHD